MLYSFRRAVRQMLACFALLTVSAWLIYSHSVGNYDMGTLFGSSVIIGLPGSLILWSIYRLTMFAAGR